MTPTSTIALSPDCQHVVFAGRDNGYKYVWAADARGQARAMPTAGTPLYAAFSLDGSTVAIVTGAQRSYLTTPRLTVQWSGDTADVPIRWPSQTSGVGDAAAPSFSKDQVDRLTGSLPWGWGIHDDVSDDGRWRVTTSQEPRGPGPGLVAVYGPDANGFHGRLRRRPPRWTVAAGCPQAELSLDAEFVVVTGNFDDPDDQRCDPPRESTRLYDTEGALVAAVGPRGEREWRQPYSERERRAMSEAVEHATGKPLRLRRSE